MPTTSDTQIVAIEEGARNCSLDEYLTRTCLEKNMGDIVSLRENAANARSYFAGSTIYNAVFDLDIQLIKQIASRIDGAVPASDKRGEYANIFGDAIEDVLDYVKSEQMSITPYDSPLIAMAKVLVYVATQQAGSNVLKRKERAMAVDMIFERTGGRRVDPVKLEIETSYVEPEWMALEAGYERETDGGEAAEQDA